MGQCLGAQQLRDARRVVGKVLRLGYVAMAAMSVLYVGFPNWLMAVFVREAELGEVLPYARPLFLIAVVCLVFDLQFNVLSGALRGAGDTSYTMWVNIGVVWGVFVPLVFVATRHWGLIGAWSCFIIHVLLMAALLALRVRGRTWIERGAALLEAEGAEERASGAVELEDFRSSPAV